MLVNKSTLEGVFKGFRAIADAELAKPDAFSVDAFVMDVPTDTITESYNWLDGIPAVREWVGDRFVKDLYAHNYDVSNVPYEGTIGVKRRDIEADRIGIYAPQVKMLAQRAKQHKARLFSALLSAADSTVCFDGQYLIDTDHPLSGSSSTFSNKGTSALSLDTLETAIYSLAERDDAQGEPLGISGDTLMVPPRLRHTAMKLCYSVGEPGSSDNDINTIKTLGIDVVVNPWLTETDWWFLFDSKFPVQPIIYQHRKEPEFVSVTDINDSTVFSRGEFYFGVDMDHAMAAGLPDAIYGGIV